jgi:hypothetical protein
MLGLVSLEAVASVFNKVGPARYHLGPVLEAPGKVGRP